MLSVKDHIDYILTVSSQRLYLPNKLKHAGLNLKALTVIFQATVMSHVSYALPAWYGRLLQADIGRMNALFHRAHRWQLTDRTFTIEQLGTEADVGGVAYWLERWSWPANFPCPAPDC